MTMSRWYQHVFSGEKVEVTTLAEDDKYVNVSVWSRIPAPPAPERSEAAPKSAPVAYKTQAKKKA